MNQFKNILLVEDDKDDQYFFMNAISEIDNAVLQNVANNGEEALEKLQSSAPLPDIIFMDINMPRMNGIECLTKIVNNPQLKDIPVVMLTGSIAELEVVRTIGAKAFIKKPTSEKTLRTKLEEMINLDFMADRITAACTFHTALCNL